VATPRRRPLAIRLNQLATRLGSDGAGLARDEPLMSAAAASLPEAMAVVRARDAIVEQTNAAWDRLLGYQRDELSGRHISVFVVGEDGDVPGRRLHSIVAALQQHGVWRGETEFIRKDGEAFWCTTSIAQFDDAELGPLWVMVATRPRPERP
jgi:PAS domain S-box-containing protein